MFIAHSKNSDGDSQSMLDHLRGVELQASKNAPEDMRSTLSVLSLLHDLGKYREEFQEYLYLANQGQKGNSVDHKFAGAFYLYQHAKELYPLMLLIQGHHGGLQNPTDLKAWLQKHASSVQASRRAYELSCQRGMKEGILGSVNNALSMCSEYHSDTQKVLSDPSTTITDTTSILFDEFVLRQLFSILVDADGLDTQQHFSIARKSPSEDYDSLKVLLQRLHTWRANNLSSISSPVNTARREIYDSVVAQAEGEQKLWTLPAPTGSGKTLTSIDFALGHAVAHQMDRVVIAVPFLTITEQTAAVYRNIFRDYNVLEHHSQINPERFSSPWIKLASENWDAPIILTTTVQLVNVLFHTNVSSARRFHRLANSVIIIDEAQSLPVHLLDPLLYMLLQLTEQARSRIILSTATQPNFNSIWPKSGKETWHNLLPNFDFYQKQLERVIYDWSQVRSKTATNWQELGEELKELNSFLVIVNTVKDAQTLYRLLSDGSFHLSTRMCSRHRKNILDRIRQRLSSGQDCRLVSTQLIEAGVDIDFPRVYRAVAPLDSIIQAAGRCNREGLMADKGIVTVFNEPLSRRPRHDEYTRATSITKDNIIPAFNDPTSKQALDEYFQQVYSIENLDSEQIQKARAELNFSDVTKKMSLIKNEQIPVIVSYGEMTSNKIIELEDTIENPREFRRVLRTMSAYQINLYSYQANKAMQEGKARSLKGSEGSVLVWEGLYDPYCGVVLDEPASAENLIL